MDALFGVAGRDFVVLASDTYFRNNVVVSKTDHIRCTKISDSVAVITAGDQGDCDRTTQYIFETLKFEQMANGLKITEKTYASVLQKYVHEKLRKDPVNVTSIVGGVSEGRGKIFYVDHYGAQSSPKYIGTGYASYLFLSAMDMCYRENMTEQEAVQEIVQIYERIKKQLVVNYGGLHLCVINANGVKEINETANVCL